MSGEITAEVVLSALLDGIDDPPPDGPPRELWIALDNERARVLNVTPDRDWASRIVDDRNQWLAHCEATAGTWVHPDGNMNAKSLHVSKPLRAGALGRARLVRYVIAPEGVPACPDCAPCACGPSHDCRATGCDPECPACCGE